MESLTEAMGSPYEHRFGEAQNENYGNAVVSRKPILSFQNFVVAIGKIEKRACLRITVAHPSKATSTLSVYVLHLHHTDESTRVAQLNKILHEFVDQSEDHVIMGDFNALKKEDYESEYLRDISTNLKKAEGRDICFEVTEIMKEKCYRDLWQELNPGKINGACITCKWNCRIDYIWVSSGMWNGLSTKDSFCIILDNRISDHSAVCAGITFM